MKLNVDGAFSTDGSTCAGMVLRNHAGEIIVAASWQLRTYADAVKSELVTLEESLALALNWTQAPINVESECQ